MIICAAIKRGDQVIRGHRHSDCIYVAVTNYGRTRPCHTWEQGFLNSDGKFLDREEAMLEAIVCNQVSEDTKTRQDRWLYSEDLY